MALGDARKWAFCLKHCSEGHNNISVITVITVNCLHKMMQWYFTAIWDKYPQAVKGLHLINLRIRRRSLFYSGVAKNLFQ